MILSWLDSGLDSDIMCLCQKETTLIDFLSSPNMECTEHPSIIDGVLYSLGVIILNMRLFTDMVGVELNVFGTLLKNLSKTCMTHFKNMFLNMVIKTHN